MTVCCVTVCCMAVCCVTVCCVAVCCVTVCYVTVCCVLCGGCVLCDSVLWFVWLCVVCCVAVTSSKVNVLSLVQFEYDISRENKLHYSAEGFIQIPLVDAKELFGIKFRVPAEGEEFYAKIVDSMSEFKCGYLECQAQRSW